MTERSFGVLSGIEIAEAVERHKKYLQLREELAGADTFAHTDHRPHLMRCLEREPRIHIDNFDSTPSDEGGSLGANSYDLHLGQKVKTYRLRNGLDQLADGTSTLQGNDASCVLSVTRDNPTVEVELPQPPDVFVLRPGELYLMATAEHTESHNCVPMMEGRSSLGRLGISIHATAGAGDAGFCGRWVLEVQVVKPVGVFAGLRVCQLLYYTINPHKLRPYRGKYQNQQDVVHSRFFMDFEDKV